MRYTIFAMRFLNNKEIEIGGIDDAEEGIKIYEAFKQGPNRLIKI